MFLLAPGTPLASYALGYVCHYAADLHFSSLYISSVRQIPRKTFRTEGALDFYFRKKDAETIASPRPKKISTPRLPPPKTDPPLHPLYAVAAAQAGRAPLLKGAFLKSISLFRAYTRFSARVFRQRKRLRGKCRTQTMAISPGSRQTEKCRRRRTVRPRRRRKRCLIAAFGIVSTSENARKRTVRKKFFKRALRLPAFFHSRYRVLPPYFLCRRKNILSFCRYKIFSLLRPAGSLSLRVCGALPSSGREKREPDCCPLLHFQPVDKPVNVIGEKTRENRRPWANARGRGERRAPRAR